MEEWTKIDGNHPKHGTLRIGKLFYMCISVAKLYVKCPSAMELSILSRKSHTQISSDDNDNSES